MTLTKECINSRFRMRRLGDFNLNKVSIPERISSRRSPEFHGRALRSSPSARHGVPRYNTCILPVVETSPTVTATGGAWRTLPNIPRYQR